MRSMRMLGVRFWGNFWVEVRMCEFKKGSESRSVQRILGNSRLSIGDAGLRICGRLLPCCSLVGSRALGADC